MRVAARAGDTGAADPRSAAAAPTVEPRQQDSEVSHRRQGRPREIGPHAHVDLCEQRPGKETGRDYQQTREYRRDVASKGRRSIGSVGCVSGFRHRSEGILSALAERSARQ